MASRENRRALAGIPTTLRAWAELMQRLGYKRYVAQGGDWGSVVADVMVRQAPPGLQGIHINMPLPVFLAVLLPFTVKGLA